MMAAREQLAILALFMAGAGLGACGGSGGGSPTGPSVAASIVRVDDPGGALREHETTIRELLESTAQQVSLALELSGVTIAVIPDRGRAIAGYGLGGFTPSGSLVEMYVDPSFPGLAQHLADRVPRLAAHELHHARRWRGPGYGRTLFDAIVSEGLADHFSVELLGEPPPPWSDAFPRDRTAHFFDLARPELDSSTYDHERWFFSASPTLPRWTGYTLGYRVVEAYKASRPGTTAAQLVTTPAEAFRGVTVP